MRLHSDIIRASDVRDALAAEIKAGRVAATVEFKILVEHSSRSHQFGCEVQLSSWNQVPGDGRRRGNDGAYGSMTENYAATFDEWGHLISALYRLDPLAIWGSAKHPVYDGVLDFDRKTGMSYNLALLPLLEAGEDPFPYVYKRQDRVGRRGSCRNDDQATAWGSDIYEIRPRTVAEFREFAKI